MTGRSVRSVCVGFCVHPQTDVFSLLVDHSWYSSTRYFAAGLTMESRPEADLRVLTTFSPMGASGQDPVTIDVSVTNVGKAPADNTTTTTTPNKNPLNIAVSGGGVRSCAPAPGAGQPGQPLAMLGLRVGCALIINRRRVAQR